MTFHMSERLAGLSGYAFDEIRKKVEALKKKGIAPIDFGVGDPTEPTPQIIREALKVAVDARATSGYPNYSGDPKFRKDIAAWTKRRYGVELSPDTEICATIGAKEAVFNFPEAFINPGDVVLVPNPGYPPYERGTQFAEGKVFYLNLFPERGFLPDLSAVPADVCKKAKILWVNYPNNPTGAMAPRKFFEEAVAFGKKYNIIVASDEAYSENYYGDERPVSILEVARTGIVAFNSFSKRSCMTGWRVGWIAGDAEIVTAFKKLKTNIDSGTPTFIQDAAAAGLRDETHVKELRTLYRTKRDIIAEAFSTIGLSECRPAATLHYWQRIPKATTALSFAERLLDPKIAIVSTPGNWISANAHGINPGENFIRLSLVPSVDECRTAAERIVKYLK